ncbi:hypothetical protein [Curtobacterium sp. MCSS17_011]|nr:hypothetical protein [Curtobacterium sp. MCSS17_011]
MGTYLIHDLQAAADELRALGKPIDLLALAEAVEQHEENTND